MPSRTVSQKTFFLIALLTLILAGLACSLLPSQITEPPTAVSTSAVDLPADEPTADSPQEEMPATISPTAAAPSETAPIEGLVTADFDSVTFSFGLDVANQWKVEFIPQGPGRSSSAGPFPYTDPEHLIFSLENYALPETCCNPLNQPQIIVYPVVQMSEQNPVATTQITALQTYLASPPANLMDQFVEIPFLPLFNAAQTFHTQVRFVDFQNGKGVRYLTQYSQGPMPVNNASIFYTFQGITNDGSYYVAVTMPVTHPSLKNNAEEVFDLEGDAFMTDPINYINGVTQALDSLDPGTFTPGLDALDAMIQSLMIRP